MSRGDWGDPLHYKNIFTYGGMPNTTVNVKYGVMYDGYRSGKVYPSFLLFVIFLGCFIFYDGKVLGHTSWYPQRFDRGFDTKWIKHNSGHTNESSGNWHEYRFDGKTMHRE